MANTLSNTVLPPCMKRSANETEALRWLDKDVDDRDGLGSWLVWLNYDPVWTAARTDPQLRRYRSGLAGGIHVDGVAISSDLRASWRNSQREVLDAK